jgi:hypothetical protein
MASFVYNCDKSLGEDMLKDIGKYGFTVTFETDVEGVIWLK